MEATPPIEPTKPTLWSSIKIGLYILGTIVLFLFALDLMIASLQHLEGYATETILMATSNPFTGLFIGLLITALIQSSSTTTSLVVALVASGSISIEHAVPILMGANVGTTITSTLISFGFINRKKEFKRAVAAGTYHDFFNILTVLILFPLEYYNGFLSGISTTVTRYFFDTNAVMSSRDAVHVLPGFGGIFHFLKGVMPNSVFLITLSFALLFTSIIVFRRIISTLLLARVSDRFSKFFFKNEIKAFLWGLGITAIIRSSSVTTSVVVPLVAKKLTSLRKIAPFILGANIGTTITAFIAGILNNNTSGTLSIAIAHLLFNLIGILIFFPFPFLREVPIKLATALGRLTLKFRLSGLVYILITFFFIPFALIYLNRDAVDVLEADYQKTNFTTGSQSFYRVVATLNKHNPNGRWITFLSGSSKEPYKILSAYKINNVLFIDNAMYLFNQPGFCWDGNNFHGEKYESCIREIKSTFSISAQLTFDSVFVYEQKFYDTLMHPMSFRYYISFYYPLIVRKETLDKDNLVIEREEITNLEKK